MSENNDAYIPLSDRSDNTDSTNKTQDNSSGTYVPISDRPQTKTDDRELVEDTNPKSSNVSSSEVSTSRPIKTTANPRVEFDVQAFDDFILSHGIPAIWQQAFICPCIDPVTYAADPLCPICHGTYRGYLPGHKDTYVAIQSQDRGTVNTKELGRLDLGVAKGTFRAETEVNILDRITIPNLTTRQNFAFTVTEQRFNSGFYIPYDVHKILYIIGYKDRKMHDIIENIDYVYNKNERKIYIKNKKLIGATVSLILSVAVRYIVTDILKDTRYQYDRDNRFTERLPRETLLKRESILINNVPLVPSSNEDINEDIKRNQSLSKEGIKLVNAEKSSSFGLGDI